MSLRYRQGRRAPNFSVSHQGEWRLFADNFEALYPGVWLNQCWIIQQVLVISKGSLTSQNSLFGYGTSTWWWFQTFVIFTPYLGKWSKLTNYIYVSNGLVQPPTSPFFVPETFGELGRRMLTTIYSAGFHAILAEAYARVSHRSLWNCHLDVQICWGFEGNMFHRFAREKGGVFSEPWKSLPPIKKWWFLLDSRWWWFREWCFVCQPIKDGGWTLRVNSFKIQWE